MAKKAKEKKPLKPVDDPFSEEAAKIVQSLSGYMDEADQVRKGGENPRDPKWQENLDLYWNRYDFSHKASWQAQETMPEVPTFVDRFAAALKEALVSSPEGFYTVTDPSDKENDLTATVKRMLDAWLSVCGRNQTGHLIGFPAVFEEQAKMGALMACCASVQWKDDVKYGRVAIENIDPRMIWLDHTYRNLYRIRRFEIDRHELGGMIGKVDTRGNPIFNLDQMGLLLSGCEAEDEQRKAELAGTGQQITSNRRPIQIDEYVATVLNPDGSVRYDMAVCLVANKRYLIRGPEPIPFWHGRDWMVYAPLIPVPLSPYGRSYMEDLGSIATAFNELTNLILDAVFASTIRSWVMVPSMLTNPGQIAEGNVPGKIWQLSEGFQVGDFQKALDAGTLPAESLKLWADLKNELREASSMNEIGIGQLAPHARTSATEISTAQENSSAVIRSMAHTIETRFLDPMLDLTWKTGMQHVNRNDPALRAAAGDQMFEALYATRRELVQRPITFQARGISTLIEKGAKLRALMGVLQVVMMNDVMAQAFLSEIDPTRLVKTIFTLANLDMFTLQPTEREKLARQIVNPMQQMMQGAGGGGGATSSPATQEGKGVAQILNGG